MPRIWTEEQKQFIIHAYTEEGLTCKEIAPQFGAKAATISKYLKEWGIEIKGNRTNNRLLKDNFFQELDAPEKAYIIGLMLADGNIMPDAQRSPAIRLELVDTDVEILKVIQNLLGSSGKLGYNKRANREHGTYSLNFRSKQIANDLSKWGVIPNKTYDLKELIIPEKFKEDYLRGYIDGDGSIYYSNDLWHINVCGHNLRIIEQLAELGEQLIGRTPHKITECNGVYRYTWNGQSAQQLAKILYGNNHIAIARKQEKARLAFEDKQDEDIV